MNDNVFLQNMEILREKFKISYREAKEVLESNNNDLIESLIFLEEIYPQIEGCPFSFYITSIKNKLTKLYNEGTRHRILISVKGNVVADVPLTAAVISSFAFILYPVLVLVELGSILLFDIDLKLVDKSGKIYDVNDDVKSKVNQVFSLSKDKINSIISNSDIKFNPNDIKAKATEFGKKAIDNINEIIESKISRGMRSRASDYAKFVYDVEKDEVKEEYNNYCDEENIDLGNCECENSEIEIQVEEDLNDCKGSSVE